MSGKSGAEVASVDAIGPCGADMLPHDGEVDAVPFGGLMAVAPIGRCRFGAMAQRTGQSVGQIVMALSAQRGENGSIMSTGDDGVAEFQFE